MMKTKETKQVEELVKLLDYLVYHKVISQEVAEAYETIFPSMNKENVLNHLRNLKKEKFKSILELFKQR